MRRDRHRQCWSHCYQSLMTVRPLSHRTGCNQARSRSLVVGVCTGGSFVRRCRAQAPYTRTIMTRCRSVPHYTFAPLPLVCRFAGFQSLSLSPVQHRSTTSRLSMEARYASLMKSCNKPDRTHRTAGMTGMTLCRIAVFFIQNRLFLRARRTHWESLAHPSLSSFPPHSLPPRSV